MLKITTGDFSEKESSWCSQHPAKVVETLRQKAMLVNKGEFVEIFTNNDYVIKELNILMMLGKSFEDISHSNIDKVLNDGLYTEAMALNLRDVEHWDCSLQEGCVKKDIGDFGIFLEHIDKVIDQQCTIMDELIWS